MNLREQFKAILADVSWLEAAALPSPFQELLCHDSDMTSTLTHYYGGEVSLEVLRFEHDEEQYLREVILRVGEREVEKGLIIVHLQNFPEIARKFVLEGTEPFGAILNRLGLEYVSAPCGFFRTASATYGRHNKLRGSDGTLWAEIIEILP